MLMCHYFLNTAFSISLEQRHIGLLSICSFIFLCAMRIFGLNVSCRYLNSRLQSSSSSLEEKVPFEFLSVCPEDISSRKPNLFIDIILHILCISLYTIYYLITFVLHIIYRLWEYLCDFCKIGHISALVSVGKQGLK